MAKQKPQDSQFAQESAAQSTAPSAAMIALFKQPVGLDLTKAKRLNLPQMIKPGDVPIFTEENQAVLAGELVKVVNSPSTTVKGKCLWLRIGSEERLFPVTGVVRKALAPDCEADSKELVTTIEKLTGKTIVLKRVQNITSKKYQRDIYGFDVFVLE